MKPVLKSIGSKYRIANVIREELKATGADLLVDVFGGSGSVTMTAGFLKRVYNDVDGDLVNFFRVLRDDGDRRKLLRILRNTPMSRRGFDRLNAIYQGGGRSFCKLPPVERAAATFYRSNYSYGGKMRSGGFSVSASDLTFIKEAKTYASRLRSLAEAADFWRATCLENLGYQEMIEQYGRRPNAVLYCDPPYFGTEAYYSRTITGADHVFLAEQLASCRAGAVVSYYEFDGIRDLYPERRWIYRTVIATKNSKRPGDRKETMAELILRKR
jgi:DNA adenine methylase